MTTEITSHCWVRIVDATKDSLDPTRRGLMAVPQSVGTGPKSWGVPNNSRIASWKPGADPIAPASWQPGSTGWGFADPTLGARSSAVTLDLGPAFDSRADAHKWMTTPEGQAWADEALSLQLLVCETHLGETVTLAPAEVATPDCYPKEYVPKKGCPELFDEKWWGPAFLQLHEQKIDGPILDFDKLREVVLPGYDFAQSRAECDALLELQYSRTPAQVAQCFEEAQGCNALIWPILETSTLNLEKLKTVEGRQLIERMLIAIDKVVYQHKRIYMRARPAQFEPRLDPLFKGPRYIAEEQTSRLYPGHPSFPSGHATMVHAWSKLIQELKADRRSTDAVARRIAFNREVAGVHYRSDSVAGEHLAQEIVEQMFGANSLATDWLAEFMSLTR